MKKEFIITGRKANVFGAWFTLAAFAVALGLYFGIWGVPVINKANALNFGLDVGVWYGLVLLGIVVHELLHAVAFMYWGSARWSDIKFGINWKYLTPYAHCKVPVAASAYRKSLLLPGLVLGVLPLIIGIATGSLGVTCFGAIHLGSAGGDVLIYSLIRKLNEDILLQDHPEKIGCETAEEVTGEMAMSR
ncbi:MAG: DUF3267 domain-containing protein [Hymenobacteraceae bacterium]|nr:DUF3267 domain-containing protein [Hymenobacteraceae bacterium]MDX5395259.1 DUF3267 domain-containing protein [Hymenobacteraceae bacterium]MDX5511297.1 DUF3267 domain-containing protein [Hymenobacteraceae bacterium]